MNAAELSRKRINQIAWISSLLLMAVSWLILSLINVHRPHRREVPGIELLTWVHQVYQSPSRVDRVAQQMRRQRARLIQLPEERFDPSERRPQINRVERDTRDLTRPAGRDLSRDISDSSPTRDLDRPRDVIRRDTGEMPRITSEGRDRVDSGPVASLQAERSSLRDSQQHRDTTPHSMLEALDAWLAGLPIDAPAAPLRGFSECGPEMRRGQLELGGRAWRVWACREKDEAILLFNSSTDLFALRMSGDDLALRTVKQGELINDTVIARFTRLAEGGTLHADLLQFLEAR